jgi:hypothetical protein
MPRPRPQVGVRSSELVCGVYTNVIHNASSLSISFFSHTLGHRHGKLFWPGGDAHAAQPGAEEVPEPHLRCAHLLAPRAVEISPEEHPRPVLSGRPVSLGDGACPQLSSAGGGAHPRVCVVWVSGSFSQMQTHILFHTLGCLAACMLQADA